MSRVGKVIIQLPSSVKVTLGEMQIEAIGPLGKLSCDLPRDITVACEGNTLIVTPDNDSKQARSLWGTVQRNVANLVHGVDKGFVVSLELSGVGYRAMVQGSNLVLQLGFSHDIVYPIPEGITIKCEKPTSVEVSGKNKQLVGQVAAEIRRYRKPEPYKGKGIIRKGEFVLRKEGKKK